MAPTYRPIKVECECADDNHPTQSFARPESAVERAEEILAAGACQPIVRDLSRPPGERVIWDWTKQREESV